MIEGKHDPHLVTFILFTYNQERWVEQAVRGVLGQSYQPLEIIISDDASTDRTFEVIKETVASYQGPHDVTLNRNNTNIGAASHINRIVTRARGHLIVVAAGDDVSLQERTRVLVEEWRNHPNCHLVYSNVREMDEHGGLKDAWLAPGARLHPESIAEAVSKRACTVIGSSSAFTKELFEVFGPINASVVHEDNVLPFRALLIGCIAYVDRCLVHYRRHASNTWKSCRNGRVKKDVVEAQERQKRIILSWLYDLATVKQDTEEIALPLARHYQFLCSYVGAIDGGVFGGIINTPRAISAGRARDLYRFFRDSLSGRWRV